MKKFNFKKGVAIIMSVLMTASLVACGGTDEKKDSDKGKDSNTIKTAETVTGPVTIEFWHSRGSGANGENMAKVIQRFNETNEYGITVVGTYMDDYDNCLSKSVTSIAAGNNPTLIVASSGGIELLAEKGILADMSPYIERDEFDVNNIPESLQYFMHWNDEVLSMPYTVSTPVFYYNKALWGTETPTSIQDLATKAAAVKANTGVMALGMTIDSPFIQRPLLKSLGSTGTMNEEGTGSGCLDDGSLVQLLSDWSSWIDAGWCMRPDITSTGTKMTEDFYQGKLASMIYSTGSMVNIITKSKATGIDLGVAKMVGYDGYTASVGGGHLVMLESNHSGQEIAAAWEFVKFLLADEQVAENTVDTGYLPVTYSSVETDTIKTLFAENPAFAEAYSQVKYATYNTRSTASAEWNTQMQTAISYVIQDESMTPEEAVDYLKTQEKIIFY